MAAGEGFVFGGSPWKDADGPSLYSALNVPSNASEEDVRSAYRRMCVTFHPDKHNTAPAKDKARLLFENIKQAYSILSNPEQRLVYDAQGWPGLREKKSIGLPCDGVCRTELEMDELRSRFHRQVCEDRNRKMCSPSCGASMTLDARGVFAHTDRKTIAGVSFSKAALKQSFQIVLSPRDRIHCNLSAVVDSDQDINGGAVCAYQHAFGSGSILQCELGVGNLNYAGTQFQAALPAACQLTLSGKVYSIPLIRFSDTPTFPISTLYSAAVQRRVGPCMVRLQFKSGSHALGEESLQTNVSYNNDTDVSFKLKKTGDVSLRCGHQLHITPSLLLHPEISISRGGVRFSYRIRYQWNSRTDITVGIRVKYPSAVDFMLGIEHDDQSFELPVAVADNVSLSAIVYAHAVPLALVGLLRYCVVKPLMYIVSREQRKEEERCQLAAVAAQRNEAAMFVRLMGATYTNSVAAERARRGLVVVEAWYGALISYRRPGADRSSSELQQQVADVKVATQCLVRDSKLILNADTKCTLPGFFDPVPSLRKSLRVRYEFHGLLHEVTVADTEALEAPKRAHLIR